MARDLLKTNSNKKLTINQGTTIRHSEISKLNLNTNNGESYISIFSGKPRKFPIFIQISKGILKIFGETKARITKEIPI